MELVMVTVGASGLACWLVAVVLLPRRPRKALPVQDSEPRNPSRDEDRVRPAVTASGEQIWLEPDELVWHEIVAWPRPRTAGRHGGGIHRSA